MQWFTLALLPKVTLPDVVGRTRAVAERVVRETGLTSAVAEAADDRVRKGLVVSTDPEPGHDASPGDTVTLVVSTGRPS